MANGRKTGGRTAGTPNRFSADVKAMVLGALEQVGGQDYLARQADANPGAFMTLVGKVLPLQLSGANNGPVEMIVTGVRRSLEIEPESEFEPEPQHGIGRD
jgi:hypothetical protein